MKKYIDKIKAELAMSGYLDGWTIRWYKEKLKQLITKPPKNPTPNLEK